MPVAPLQCPHCAGPLQVDTASAGQQVICPHCHGPLVVPPEELLAQMLAAVPEMPPPPVSHEALTLSCPVCTGPFQVLPSMSGQQLGCPHCGSAITIPPLGSVEPSPPGPTELAPDPGHPPEFSAASTTEAATSLPPLPPPVQLPPGSETRSSDRFPPGMQPSSPAAGASEDRYPPGVAPRASRAPQLRTREPAIKPAAREDRYPPGMGPPKSQTDAPTQPTAAPRSRIDLNRSDRLPPTPTSPRVDDLLPPGAAADPSPWAAPPSPVSTEPAGPAVEDVLPSGAAAASAMHVAMPATAASSRADALLPPGAADSPAASQPAAAAGHPASMLDALLPPGAVGSSDAAPAGAQLPIPAAPKKLPVAPANLPAGAIAVPTPEGGFVTVRETPKTIGHGNEAIEVRRLSPEEKARRRLRNNLVIGSFCLIVIIVVVVVLLL